MSERTSIDTDLQGKVLESVKKIERELNAATAYVLRSFFRGEWVCCRRIMPLALHKCKNNKDDAAGGAREREIPEEQQISEQ